MKGSSLRSCRGALAVGCLALLAAGCSSLRGTGPGDGSFDAGDWPAAVAAYEARLERGGGASKDADLKLRLALARAAAADSAGELDRARELLEQLRSSPDLVGHASALLEVLDRQRLLEAQLAATARDEESLRTVLHERERRIAELEEALAAAEEDVTAQVAAVEELRRALASVSRELEELKRIDLELGPSRD